jgi:hypothetical protein
MTSLAKLSKGSDINGALLYLKNEGIEAFDLDNILVVPCESAEEIYNTAEKVRRLLKECGYEKSWRIDPYFFERRNSLSEAMFGSSQ